jgi:hypothetical protein
MNIVTSKTRLYYTQKPPLGSTVNWSHPLAKGAVGIFLMNEGGGNLSVNLANFKSSLLRVNSQVPSRYGNSWKLIGGSSGDCIVKNGGSLCFKSPQYTIVSFFRQDNNGGNEGAIYNEDIGGGTTQRFRIDGTYHLDVGFANSITSNGTLTPGNYYQCAVTCIQNTTNGVKLYINGKLDKQANSGSPVSSVDLSRLFQYGQGAYSPYGLWIYTYIWNRALSPSEIQSLYVAPYQMIQPLRRTFYSIPQGTVQTVLTGRLERIQQIGRIQQIII